MFIETRDETSHFLANLQKSEEQERGECGGWNHEISPLSAVDLELDERKQVRVIEECNRTYREEEQVQPERHAEVSLISKWQWRVSDSFQVLKGILENTEISHEISSDCWLDKTATHNVVHVARGNGQTPEPTEEHEHTWTKRV